MSVHESRRQDDMHLLGANGCDLWREFTLDKGKDTSLENVNSSKDIHQSFEVLPKGKEIWNSVSEIITSEPSWEHCSGLESSSPRLLLNKAHDTLGPLRLKSEPIQHRAKAQLRTCEGKESTHDVWPKILDFTHEQDATLHIPHVAAYLRLLNVHGAVESLDVASLYCET